MKSDIHDVSVQFQHETEKGVCIREAEDDRDIWLPSAEVEIDGARRRGAIVTLTAPVWLLTEKGLI